MENKENYELNVHCMALAWILMEVSQQQSKAEVYIVNTVPGKEADEHERKQEDSVKTRRPNIAQTLTQPQT